MRPRRAATDRSAAAIAATTENDPSGDQSHRTGCRDHHGLQHKPELLDAEVMPRSEDRQPRPTRQGQVAHEADTQTVLLGHVRSKSSAARHLPRRPSWLGCLRIPTGDRDQDNRAADQHEVGRPPTSDVLPNIRCQTSSRETDERIQTTCRHQQTANWSEPRPGDADGGEPGLSYGNATADAPAMNNMNSPTRMK